MKKTISTLLFLLIFNTSFAQVEGIAAGAAVNDVVNNFKTQLEDLAFSLEGIMTRQSFDMRQHVMVITNNLDYILDKNINKTFDRLDATQQKFLNDIQYIIQELQNPINQTIDKLELITDKANSFAASLPGGKRATLLSKTIPLFVTQKNSSDVKVAIKGSWLATGNPFITINSKNITPASELDSKLEFIIPNLTVDTTKIKLNSIPLTVYQKRFIGKRKLNYTIGVTTVPNYIGKYELEITTFRIDTIKQTFNRETSHRNDHCQGARDVILTVTASTGYKIDTKSITHSGNVRENCTYNGLRSVTESGYQVTAICRNSGSCEKLFGKIVSYDARGSVNLYTRYTEYRTEEKINTEKITMDAKGFWGEDYIFKLPENTKSFVLTITKINGEKIIVTDTHSDKWLNIKYNKPSNTILIAPRPVEEAF